MNLELLNELGRTWQIYVDDEVNNCEQAARIVGRLAQNLALAAGDKNDTGAEAARAQFYFAVDQPFRRWLQGIDPETDEPVEKAAEWQEQAYRLAAELADRWWSRRGPLHSSGIAFRIKRIRKRVICIQHPRPTTAFCMICGSCTRNRMKEGQNENQ